MGRDAIAYGSGVKYPPDGIFSLGFANNHLLENLAIGCLGRAIFGVSLEISGAQL